MKIVCIDTEKIKGFTYGNVYEIIEESYYMYLTINDYNEKVTALRSRFIDLEKWRELRINTILNS